MAVGSETFIAGEYTVTFGGVALGIQEGDAGLPSLEHSMAAEPIANTSSFGKTTLDGVFTGGNYFMGMTCLEYRAGPITAFWPYHATLGRIGTIGTLLYGMSVALVLTATAGTPAAASPATLTASRAFLQPGFTSRIMFGPTLRKVPLRFQLLPYLSTGNPVVFTTT
jgi:hypothetical protein